MKIKKIAEYFSRIQKYKSTSIIKYELIEREFIFYNLILPNFFGIQLPINFLLLPILPEIVEELNIVANRTSGSDDRIVDLFEIIDL